MPHKKIFCTCAFTHRKRGVVLDDMGFEERKALYRAFLKNMKKVLTYSLFCATILI